MKKLALIFILFLFFPKTVFANTPPTLLTPLSGSTVSSTTLTWQAPPYQVNSSSPYRIQVDDNSDFSSPEKDYYTSNTHYSPSLNYGTWSWRVKAKDSSGIWSNWSNSWSFNYSASINSPSPSPTPTPFQTQTSPAQTTTSYTAATSQTSSPKSSTHFIQISPSTDSSPKEDTLSSSSHEISPVPSYIPNFDKEKLGLTDVAGVATASAESSPSIKTAVASDTRSRNFIISAVAAFLGIISVVIYEILVKIRKRN